MMESLLERLDGRLTTSDRFLSFLYIFLLYIFIVIISNDDRTKWHGYRYRPAAGGSVEFHFDYYPKFWLTTTDHPDRLFEETLVEILRRFGRLLSLL